MAGEGRRVRESLDALICVYPLYADECGGLVKRKLAAIPELQQTELCCDTRWFLYKHKPSSGLLGHLDEAAGRGMASRAEKHFATIGDRHVSRPRG